MTKTAQTSTRPNRSALRMVVVLSVVALAILFASFPAKAGPRLSVFGTVERQSTDLTPFTKWTTTLSRYGEEAADADYRDLDRFLATLTGQSPLQQLAAINAHIAAKGYVTDSRNWGRSDYWATPAEFFARSGDCEDHAIAKFFALKRLGWNADALRLATVKDTQVDAIHTVLIAFDGETSWLLDNQIGEVVRADDVSRYQPLYSINEGAWWRHGGRA